MTIKKIITHTHAYIISLCSISILLAMSAVHASSSRTDSDSLSNSFSNPGDQGNPVETDISSDELRKQASTPKKLLSRIKDYAFLTLGVISICCIIGYCIYYYYMQLKLRSQDHGGTL